MYYGNRLRRCPERGTFDSPVRWLSSSEAIAIPGSGRPLVTHPRSRLELAFSLNLPRACLMASSPGTGALDRARAKAYVRLLPILLASYVIAYVDRINIGFAKLTMQPDLEPLGFSEGAFGFGMGIFFVGYLVLEIPGTLLVERWSARKWISRIMISWGVVAALTAFVHYRVPGVTWLAELAVRGLASLFNPLANSNLGWLSQQIARNRWCASCTGQPVCLAVLLGAILARTGRSWILPRCDRLFDPLVSEPRSDQDARLVFHRHATGGDHRPADLGTDHDDRDEGQPASPGHGRLAVGLHLLGNSSSHTRHPGARLLDGPALRRRDGSPTKSEPRSRKPWPARNLPRKSSSGT